MFSLRKGHYQMQSQEFFKYAPVSKAWLCMSVFTYIICLYMNYNYGNKAFSVSIRNIMDFKSVYRILLSKQYFKNPPSFVGAVVLIYYARWIERRFGSKKYFNFQNFIVINFLQSVCLEICFEIALYSVMSKIYGYNPSTYFATGPYSLLTAVYITFCKEIPVVSYGSILGISFSIHNLPFIMFVQLFEASRPRLIILIAGALSAFIYMKYSNRINIVPSYVAEVFSSPSNPIGWLTKKFADFGERGREGKILPVAATLERQRVEVVDEYERQLMFRQMQRFRASSSGSRIRFLGGTFVGGRSNLGVNTPPTEDQIRQLMDMGFDNRQTVIDALQQCDNDASAAADMLLHSSE